MDITYNAPSRPTTISVPFALQRKGCEYKLCNALNFSKQAHYKCLYSRHPHFEMRMDGFYKTSTQYDSGDIGWNFYENPLNLNGTNRTDYVDYEKQMDDVRKLRVSFRAAEFLMLSSITLGLYNHIRYNHTKIRE